MSWYRWHIGSCEDIKFRVVARNASVTVATVIGAWALLLETASNTRNRGVTVRNDDVMCEILGVTPEVLRATVTAMELVGLVTIQDEEISIVNWAKRQFETDTKDNTNAERQKRYRNRKRNAAITAADNQIQITDTDTDTEKKTKSAARREPYAFEGKVVKLTMADYERWSRAFPLLDLMAELEVRDGWLASHDGARARGNWFMATQQFFKNQHAKARLNKQREEEEPISVDDFGAPFECVN